MYSYLKSRTYSPLYRALNICITPKCLAQKLNFDHLELIRELDDKITFSFKKCPTGLFFINQLPSYPE